MKETINHAKEKMTKSLNALDKEFAAVRAGRANPAVLDKVMVDYYGSPTPVNQMAAISVSEARILVIQPWDKSSLKLIEKAIQACPEFSDAYYYKADLAFGASKKVGLSFCVAYDLYAEAKQKRMALGDNSEMKTAYSAEKIQERMNQCVKYFPEYDDEFMKGTFGSGDSVSKIGGYEVHAGVKREITIPGIGTFKPVVRAIKREAKD